MPKDVPVKIDSELKKRIEELISKGENRFDYPSVKNFIDKAVLKLLKELEKEENKPSPKTEKREDKSSLPQAKLEKKAGRKGEE